MKSALQLIPRGGCLISVAGPILGFVLYPRANWLFLLAFLGIALFVFAILTRKDPTPQEVADGAEALLRGTFGNYDVDDYEHLNPKNPKLKDLWRSTLQVGGFPEEWVQLGEDKKEQLKAVIQELREMDSSRE